MQFKVEQVTPMLANVFLNNNTHNRPVKKSTLAQYARDMRNGNWRLTHQGIAIDGNGRLIDGQHRLMAIVETGVTVPMMVCREMADDVQPVIDDHARRTAGDALSLLREERITQEDVAVLRIVLELSSGRMQKVTKSDLGAALDQFGKSLGFVRDFIATKERGTTSAPPWGAVLIAWHYVEDLDRLRQFCLIFRGMELCTDDSDSAAQSLRDTLLRNGMGGGASARREVFGKTKRAIAAFSRRQPLSKIQAAHDLFPYPLINQRR
jgi:hypothetical protein